MAAKRLAIPTGTLANGVAAAKRGAPSTPGARTVPEPEADNDRRRQELAVVRLERDILKNATAYLARESLPGTRSCSSGDTHTQWT